jgi:hypothetical protein
MESSTDFAGRLSDLSSLQSFEGFKVTRMSTDAAPAGRPGRVCGMQKMLQRYATTLLTQKGSARHAGEYGTDLTGAATRGEIINRSAVLLYFALANSAALAQMRREDADPLMGPQRPDERVKSATLEDYAVDLSAARLYLKIRLESEAGADAVFILPAK